MQVGEGVPYTQIARRIQSPHHPTYQRSSQLVRHWVDTFAPVVIAPHTETHWPRVIAVDSVPFYALGRRVAFSVLGVVGYEEQGDPGRVVALHLVTGAPKTPDWEALFGSLSGSPEMVITDRNGAQIAGVGIFPNTPMIRTCRWHELIDMRELLTRDNTAIPNAADAWETIRYAAHHEKEWQTLPADIAADLALWNPLQQRAFHRWYQNRYQRLTDDFRDGLPWGWTASKTEWALREVKNAIEYRPSDSVTTTAPAFSSNSSAFDSTKPTAETPTSSPSTTTSTTQTPKSLTNASTTTPEVNRPSTPRSYCETSSKSECKRHTPISDWNLRMVTRGHQGQGGHPE